MAENAGLPVADVKKASTSDSDLESLSMAWNCLPKTFVLFWPFSLQSQNNASKGSHVNDGLGGWAE